MWVKGWLVVFAILILLFYSYYFIQILLGRPEKFENLMAEGITFDGGEEGRRSRIVMVVVIAGLSFILEGGYFILSWTGLNIALYRGLTGLFFAFEVWHGFILIPVIKGIVEGTGSVLDLMNWKVERLAAQFYVIHVLITLGLVFTA
jgi:hypothetical protein